MAVKSIRTALRGPPVGVVEATQDWGGSHVVATPCSARPSLGRVGNPLCQTLMRAGVVVVGHILAKDAPQVGLAQDQEMVQALPAHAPEEPLAVLATQLVRA